MVDVVKMCKRMGGQACKPSTGAEVAGTGRKIMLCSTVSLKLGNSNKEKLDFSLCS